jgi:hypothetical protein
MINELNINELPKKTKLFGDKAVRMTTDEMLNVFAEIKRLVGVQFAKIQISDFLQSKQTHGDLDIICLLKKDNTDIPAILNKMKDQVLVYSKNGYVHSILFSSLFINKNVHVDFVVTSNADVFISREQYYSKNDLWGAIGVISKKLHFKVGSEGTCKRFRDKRGNWHDIFITNDLHLGAELLGYTNVSEKMKHVNNVDDIVAFLLGSPMFDVSYVSFEKMNQSDRKSCKRPVFGYIVDKLRESNQHATIQDEDYFFKKLLPEEYAQTELEKKTIDELLATHSDKYNGDYLIQTFNLKPSPLVGKILKSLSDAFGTSLNDIPEDEVYHYVNNILEANR